MKLKTALRLAKKALPRRGRKRMGSTAKKAVAAIAGIAVAAGIAAGAVFAHDQAQQRRMSEQVKIMEYQREAGLNAGAYRIAAPGQEEEKKRFNPLSAALTAIGGAVGAGLAAFFGRLLGGMPGGAAAAVAGSVLPALFVLFSLFLVLYRLVFWDRPLKSFFTARNIAVMCGGSLVMAGGCALAGWIIQDQLAAALVQSVFTLAVIAAAWCAAFLGGKKVKFEPRLLILLFAALCVGTLFGGAQLWLTQSGYGAEAARDALYAGWMVAVALCFGVYVYLKRGKARESSPGAA